MRTVIWLVLIFAVAVVAATTLGSNDGLVSVYFGGWRTDLSLNLFVLGLLAAWVALTAVARGVDALLSLPRRAGQWRAQRRERAAQRALRQAHFEFEAGRYARALKAARGVLALGVSDGDEGSDRTGDPGAEAAMGQARLAARLLSAQCLHRLQDREAREAALSQALEQAQRDGERSAAEAARLMAAEHALDDREPERALRLLSELPPGVARRTHALRMRLRAARLAGRPTEALHTSRLLAKHQALSPAAAEGLRRSLAAQVLDAAHDAEQLQRAWVSLEKEDQRDSAVAVHGARRAAALGAHSLGRAWLEPAWKALSSEPGPAGAHSVTAVERDAVVLALCELTPGMGAEWLPSVERAAGARGTDAALALLAGLLFAERGLWGKALRPLEQAARAEALPARWRRRAWRGLAALARSEGDEPRAQRCERAAAALD